jgi:hypothetical protein
VFVREQFGAHAIVVFTSRIPQHSMILFNGRVRIINRTEQE